MPAAMSPAKSPGQPPVDSIAEKVITTCRIVQIQTTVEGDGKDYCSSPQGDVETIGQLFCGVQRKLGLWFQCHLRPVVFTIAPIK